MKRLIEVFFQPPLAVARVGASQNPLEAFQWETRRGVHGGHQTFVRPAVTLDVRSDGCVRPYVPNAIRFRDGDDLRPVAPFFELWAIVQEADGYSGSEPLTLGLLSELGASTESVRYTITLGNRKAQRRTLSAACAFIAQASVVGSDHGRKPLPASSPHNAGQTPLVSPERPVSLGHFQVIRPVPAHAMGVDLSQLRVRYTPGRGEVYGPPTAITGPASPLPPGGALARQTLGGRMHEIVPDRNRILNPGTPWSSFVMDTKTQEDPQPCDSYDGANVGENRSWGVVDDSCDGIIEAQVVVDGVRYEASARVLCACPDYAPDRRPFYSLADDLADRDLPPSRIDEDIDASQAEIADLFQRVFETVSLVNLDATRFHGIAENVADPMPANPDGLPRVDGHSMTSDDKGYVDLIPFLLASDLPSADSVSVQHDRLSYAAAARAAHAPMADVGTLLDVLRLKGKHIQKLIRPPFGRFRELQETLTPEMNRAVRDPRVRRDGMQDMRMPPYMRDSDQTPLSITHRQYRALMDFIRWLDDAPKLVSEASGAERLDTPVARRVNRLAERLNRPAPEPAIASSNDD